MDKNQEYYKNKNNYGDVCVPRREGILNYLIKENFLSEFSTEEEKRQVLDNLGILQKLDLLQQLINDRTDLSALLSGYVTETELIRRLQEIKPKDEKSKGYYSSYEELIANNPVNSIGDWAIVNVDGSWYVFKFTENGWQQSDSYSTDIDLSEYAKLSDLELLQRILVSGVNIKTINGQSILGEGDLEIQCGGGNVDLDNYVTKEELYNMQNPLKVSISASPSLSEYTGNNIQISINITAKKGNTTITPDSIQLSYKGTTIDILSLPYTVMLQDKGTTSFTATCTKGTEQASGSTSVSIVLPIYIGFSLSENGQNIDLSKFLKRVRSNVQMTESIQNTIAGSYLWIISPFAVSNVATDPGFTYKVKMNAVQNVDGLYYYRSNSAVDISHLTYYIK